MRNGAGSRKPVAAAAAALGGSAELVDFLIPLWAGIELGLGSAAIGMLIAVELTVSVAARPLAGRLADTFTRTRIAAAGAFLYALSCLGYAMAGSWLLALGSGSGGCGRYWRCALLDSRPCRRRRVAGHRFGFPGRAAFL